MDYVDQLAILRSLKDFTGLKISLASPEMMRVWSCGEVLKPETINYRTLKPEKDGLFDERIFGPTKDWECYCGKYKRIRYKGVVCDKCGVEVTQSRVRRERMGHISLACPVAHVWYFKGSSSRLSFVLNVPPRSLEQVIYFARHLVLSVDDESRKKALEHLLNAKNNRENEIKESFNERKELLKKEADNSKEKITAKIKNKEQLALAISEIELELRKKEQAITEEQNLGIQRANQIFDNLLGIVKSLTPMSVLSEEEYDRLYEYGASNFFVAKMGAEAILQAISEMDLNKLVADLRQEVLEVKVGSGRYAKIAKRLKTLDAMRKGKISPTWMILKVLPVLPPDLRPMVQLSGGRFATSDLNDLYRRVINRNNRLKHLINLGAPEIILRNEKRMLQEAVDSLIDTSQKKATRKGRGKQNLKSLSDMLKGKQGRFRQNLLGKRVDYSGRSVIVVGPELKLNECGLPKDMALEMFKPFVLREMISRGIAPNVRSAKNMLERKPDEVFDILEEITKGHPVLLNRAPTLHKLGILAFYPVLVEGSAIRLHPAVCNGFNADFDGDQMAVHIPLSKKAIEEAEKLMLPQFNLLKPSEGTPVITPARKEMALGVYYLTSVDNTLPEAKTIFSDESEAIFANQTGNIQMRQLISVRINNQIIKTTVGRIMFNNILPEAFRFVNDSVPAGKIKEIFIRAYNELSPDEVVEIVDAIKTFGFMGGTLSGLSFSVDDAVFSPEKGTLLKEAEEKVKDIENNYVQGLITNEEKKRLSQGVWVDVAEDIADSTWNQLEENNPIKIVIGAKAGRVSRDQIKQLSAMRGLVMDPLGKVVEMPIKSNFREGLSVFEYVTSGRGSRKGLTDTALKTADAGYLTRRLVDVSHDVIVREDDCGTTTGFAVKRHIRSSLFADRLLGRVLASDLIINKKTLAVAGDTLTKELVSEIEKSAITEVNIFSPLTCQAADGICKKCYGWDLSNNKHVEIGTPVGVIAAQSIGEPGTQLTLQTKHSGGVVGLDVTQGLPRVEELFEARTPKMLSPISEISGKVIVTDTDQGFVVKVINSAVKPKDEREYIVSKTMKLIVEDGQKIEAGAQLASGSLDIKEILSIKGILSAQEYLINQIQSVYESQGIPINDKHFEVIVRKMSDQVKVASSGDTDLLPGEVLARNLFEKENRRILASGGEPATAGQVILGISKRSLFTESWLSAASFEMTTDVLTESSLQNRNDDLLGLKENVIIGRLIPVSAEH